MAPYASITVALFSFLSLVHGAVADTCYYPDGSSDDSHYACSSGGTSMCCSEGFECLSNGLCNDNRYSNYQRVLRGGCTDKSWGDGCLQTCTSMWPGGEESVYLCSNGKYCCGRSNDCCNADGSFFNFGQPQVVALAGRTKAQSVDTTPDEEKDSQPSTKAGQSGTAQQPATKASAQSTDVQAQSVSQQTQNAQGDSPAATTQAQALSASQASEPAATNAPSNSNNSNSAQNSASDATRTAGSNKNDPSNTISNANANPTVTNTITINNNTTTTTTPSSSSNTVAIAAGVGVTVGVLLFLGALAAIWYLRRRRRRGAGARSKDIHEMGGSDTPVAEAGDAGVGEKDAATPWSPIGRRESGMVYEMDGGEKGVELEAGRGVKELDGVGVGKGNEEEKWPGVFKKG